MQLTLYYCAYNKYFVLTMLLQQKLIEHFFFYSKNKLQV